MTGTRVALGLFGALALLALAHCGSSDSSGSGAPGGGPFPGADAGYASGGSGGYAFDAAAEAAPPPEKELESSFQAPVATGKYVWTANPDSGRVALIDATTFDIKLAEAGFGPTYVAAVSNPSKPDDNAAIVLNVKSHDATLLRVQPDGSIQKKTLPTHAGANRVLVSSQGSWAIAWTDASAIANPDPTDGFQDVTVLGLVPGKESSTILSVGYRPTRLAFAADEQRAFAVTEPGVSVVSLDGAGPEVSGLVEVSDNPLEDPASRDVTITPDGAYALVRHDASPDVSLVSLTDGTRTDVALSGNVTDLDLSDDGSRAVAVVRDKSEIAVLPVPGVATAPTVFDTKQIPGETIGSVSLSPGATVALLYTNATANDHLSIVDLRAGSTYLDARTVALKAPVSAVFPAEDALHAVVLQTTAPGSSKAGAFSVVPTLDHISPKITGTDAAPNAVAIQPGSSSDHALVTVRNDAAKIFGVYLVRLANLQVDFVSLASPPLATGVVAAANKGYVAQQHPDGRITFVDFTNGSVRTLTGFELGAKVVY